MSVKALNIIKSDITLFETFLNKIQKSLKFLGIYVKDIYNNPKLGLKVLKKITCIVNLQELHLYFNKINTIFCERLGDVLHCIGFKCKTIKK